MTSLSRQKLFYDTHLEVVINRGKFDVYTSSSLVGVKARVLTYTRTDKIVLYIPEVMTVEQKTKL